MSLIIPPPPSRFLPLSAWFNLGGLRSFACIGTVLRFALATAIPFLPPGVEIIKIINYSGTDTQRVLPAHPLP